RRSRNINDTYNSTGKNNGHCKTPYSLKTHPKNSWGFDIHSHTTYQFYERKHIQQCHHLRDPRP
ncbi:hypothetical protein, partial [Methyloglobulus sp.]|uniref:hypothetical protein n=1 Tax=Methyloglobulus sp. TaxID=2518622 RepID=UPI0032B76242